MRNGLPWKALKLIRICMRFFKAFILCTLIGCTTATTATTAIVTKLEYRYSKIKHDKIFDSFIKEFHELTDLYIGRIKIRVTDKMKEREDNKTTIGICYYSNTYTSRYNHIEINREFWTDSSYITRKSLIFHELSHCVGLYFEHSNSNMPDGICPISIMDAVMPPEYCLLKNWNFYEQELKERIGVE